MHCRMWMMCILAERAPARRWRFRLFEVEEVNVRGRQHPQTTLFHLHETRICWRFATFVLEVGGEGNLVLGEPMT